MDINLIALALAKYYTQSEIQKVKDEFSTGLADDYYNKTESDNRFINNDDIKPVDEDDIFNLFDK